MKRPRGDSNECGRLGTKRPRGDSNKCGRLGTKRPRGDSKWSVGGLERSDQEGAPNGEPRTHAQ